jgi:D-lactate dehydrogenase
VSLDLVLRRNDQTWFEDLPPEVRAPISHAIYYGHFFCRVFHQDYIVREGHDPKALEHRMLEHLERARRRVSSRAQCGALL